MPSSRWPGWTIPSAPCSPTRPGPTACGSGACACRIGVDRDDLRGAPQRDGRGAAPCASRRATPSCCAAGPRPPGRTRRSSPCVGDAHRERVAPARRRAGVCPRATATRCVSWSSRPTRSISCIPRGGEALIRFVRENARVPVIAHASGVCHLFVDAGADVEMATRLAVNAKLQRPGVCNALECLLVDAERRGAAAAAHRARAARRRVRAAGLRAHARPRAGGAPRDGRRLGTRVPRPHPGRACGRRHRRRARPRRALRLAPHRGDLHARRRRTPTRWRREVDAACVVVNASTRFHDGGRARARRRDRHRDVQAALARGDGRSRRSRRSSGVLDGDGPDPRG